MKDSTYMGNLFTCQLKGQTVTVRVIEVEQRPIPSKRGKWVCTNLATGAKLWRTSRQLHPVVKRTVTAKCVRCQSTREIGPGEVPEGDVPMCEQCGMPMTAESATVTT